jgi:hypothetical protein
MSIVPDDKDWTWVLSRPCSECGFDASRFPSSQVAALLRANAAAWVDILAAPGADLHRRPDDETWSTLEYACHIRDVHLLYRLRLGLMLSEDNPLYPNWDQDATALEDDYSGQDPAAVSTQLLDAAEALANAFDHVPEPAWQRRGRRSDGAEFTVDSFSRYLAHDPVHHLYDVTGQRAALS